MANVFLGVVNSVANDEEFLRRTDVKSPNMEAKEGDGELGLDLFLSAVLVEPVNSVKLSSC